MSRMIVLGAGMVGRVMAADLAADGIEVALADLREESLRSARDAAGGNLTIIKADLADPSVLTTIIRPFDVVLGALASRIGFQTLRTVIEAGKNYCDISFMPEDAWELDTLARKHNVTAVVDCGVAPGMSNMIAGYAATAFDACDRIDICVGGLPRERRRPFEYKAGFSPHDVIEEYTRPSRIVENGRVVVREALSEPELIDVPGIGTLEAFNTDGLRSLAHFLRVPHMRERTLRYPGHIDLMRAFRATGLFGTEPIDVRGAPVVPREVIAALMFPLWTYEPGEEDLTVMRVLAEGTTAGKRMRLAWDLLDYYDRASRATSMSRTTALPATIVARMIARGDLRKTGVIPPELLGMEPGFLDRVLADLAARGVRFTRTETAF